MSEKRHVAKVSIVGEEYTIRSDATPEHTKAVAAHLDLEIRKVLGANSLIETHKAAILAAMQITDELFRERTTRATSRISCAGWGTKSATCFRRRSEKRDS